MLKRIELASPVSCLNKAAPDEPLFVLRAKDPLAARVVRFWATLAHGVHEETKIDEALAGANEIERWHSMNIPKEPGNE